MKRSLSFFGSLAMFGAALAVAAPAYAADYSTSAGNAAGAGLSFFVLCCYGIFILVALALLALWIWMLIDNFGRQEYEFPNSSGNSKNTWLIINIVGFVLGFAGIVAIVYYFMVFKKIKRGTIAPQWAGNAPAATPSAPPAPPYAPPAPTYAPPAPTYAPPSPPAAPSAPPAPPAAPPAPPTSDAPPSDPGQPPA